MCRISWLKDDTMQPTVRLTTSKLPMAKWYEEPIISHKMYFLNCEAIT
jgi:hypothetical protein